MDFVFVNDTKLGEKNGENGEDLWEQNFCKQTQRNEVEVLWKKSWHFFSGRLAMFVLDREIA